MIKRSPKTVGELRRHILVDIVRKAYGRGGANAKGGQPVMSGAGAYDQHNYRVTLLTLQQQADLPRESRPTLHDGYAGTQFANLKHLLVEMAEADPDDVDLGGDTHKGKKVITSALNSRSGRDAADLIRHNVDLVPCFYTNSVST